MRARYLRHLEAIEFMVGQFCFTPEQTGESYCVRSLKTRPRVRDGYKARSHLASNTWVRKDRAPFLWLEED